MAHVQLIGGPLITVTPADDAQRAEIIAAVGRAKRAREIDLPPHHTQRIDCFLLSLLFEQTEGADLGSFTVACMLHQQNVVRLVRAVCGPEHPLPDHLTTAA